MRRQRMAFQHPVILQKRIRYKITLALLQVRSDYYGAKYIEKLYNARPRHCYTISKLYVVHRLLTSAFAVFIHLHWNHSKDLFGERYSCYEEDLSNDLFTLFYKTLF